MDDFLDKNSLNENPGVENSIDPIFLKNKGFVPELGLDFAHINPKVRPQDDLFRFMNGDWLDNSEIPQDRASDGAFYKLYEDAEKQVRKIIEDRVQSNENQNDSRESNDQKIGNLYQSFMDEEKIEKLGISPISPFIEKALSLKDKKEFFEYASYLDGQGLAGFFYLFINTDDLDSSKYAVFIGQSGLSLPDEAFYREEAYDEIRKALTAHIGKMLELAGINNAAEKAIAILDLETKIASHHWDQVKSREADLIYNKMSLEQIQEATPNFDWSQWAKLSQTPMAIFEDLVVHQPSYFVGLDSLLQSEPLENWISWLIWHLIHETAPFLSSVFVEENFNFYGRTLSGTPQLRPRWKRGVGLVESIMGEAIGEIYVKEHFPPQAKEQMQRLVKNLLQAYRESIAELDWMSDATKQRAFAKLETFMPKIGYPDKWRDYSKLQVSPDDLIANIMAANAFGKDYEFSKLGKEVDRSIWFMTPQTVNAYYNPGLNEIVFPAAILQPPFFTIGADEAANYGGIGAVIGHEIGHGFDDQGSKYDEKGNLENWWQEEDRRQFEERTKELISQYSTLSPALAPEVKVNGELTIGENIGDLGGITIAYRAYQIATNNGKDAPIKAGLTGAQRFFFGWAQVWRGKNRPEEVKRRIAIDPHSPEEFRCNQVLKNLDSFMESFGVNESDQLYLVKEKRVKIW